jgi:nucleoside-diphosphate-sugar epimerase
MIRQLTGRPLRYLRDQLRPGDQLIYVTDFTKFQRQTGWKPQYEVAATLREIYDWWKKNRELFAPAPAAPPHLPVRLPVQELPGTAA